MPLPPRTNARVRTSSGRALAWDDEQARRLAVLLLDETGSGGIGVTGGVIRTGGVRCWRGRSEGDLARGFAVPVVVAARAHAITAAGGAPSSAGVVSEEQARAAWCWAGEQVGVGGAGDEVDRVGGEHGAGERHSAGAEGVALLAGSIRVSPGQPAHRGRAGRRGVDGLDCRGPRDAPGDARLQQLADGAPELADGG